MCLLTEAARRWEQLSQTEYHILAGKRGKEISIHLKFDFADFPHLSGMQYAQDADFGISITGQSWFRRCFTEKWTGAG